MSTFKFISYERQGDSLCLRFKNLRPSELEIQDSFQEIRKIIADEKINKVALSLGPNMECMYSVFLGKMISLQRQLTELGGKFAICHVSPQVKSIFAACKLDDRFCFAEDFPSAIIELGK